MLKNGQHTAGASQNVTESHCHKPRVLALQPKQYEFCNPFCDTHNVGGPDCLVRGKHYEVLNFELAGDQGNVVSSEDVINDCLKAVQFHHRYMFISRGME